MIRKISDPAIFKQKALQWAAGFGVCCYLDSNGFKDASSKFECLIAVGAKSELKAGVGTAFNQLEDFRKQHAGWITGFFTYDLKNEIEDLSSANADYLEFPDLYFFVPEQLLILRENEVEIVSDDPQAVLKKIFSQELIIQKPQSVNIQSSMSKQAYVEAVGQIKEHIARGDIYVTNFCQEFFAENAVIDPLNTFLKLNDISPNPFSAFLRLKDKYVLCASPERFLAKRADKLISQPIKGTARRGATAAEDQAIIDELRNQTKELQENVMVVDLVRNDLTHSAKQGTVVTEELFGIYSFRHLHQMISTVTCQIAEDVSDIEAIRNTFPMGSMTGAPKISAMQLMEQYEQSKRGLYSGAIGYFDPDGDFDFNVVIRTLLYDAVHKYLSFQAGSAITFHAEAEKEYEECLLKAKAILEVLGAVPVN